MDSHDPLPNTAATRDVPPVDLDIRVTLVQINGKDALRYVLHSPRGAVDFYYKAIPGEALVGSPEAFQESLLERLEKMHAGFGSAGEILLLEEIAGDLEDLGRWLYRELFPEQLRAAYRKFRGAVTALQVTSDEPWIPWELIKPYDNSDPAEVIDDEFLCIRFQLTRWLAGEKPPAGAIPVTRVATVDAGQQASGPELSFAAEERELLTRLASDNPDVADLSLSKATFGQLKTLLEGGGVDLLHFVGHGDYAAGRPDESKIELADRPFLPQNLTGPVQTQLRRDRPLVFLNACRVARQGWTLTGLGGWAKAWVRDSGCGAFIAPQWVVPDDLAYEFARRFYEALKDGKTFGEAARETRQTMKEEQPGRPAWLAYSVYAHPNGRLLLGPEAIAVRPPTPRYARAWVSAPQEIRKHIIDQGRFIEEKTESFVGRQWIFEMIDRFIEREPRGYFLLRGDPGIGKSALLAEMVRREGYLHHFNVRAEGINRAETFLANICAQLIAAHALSYTFLPPEATGDARFLNSLLEQAATKRRARGEKVILLVDALDEVDTTSQSTGANTLFLPASLPRGVYVIATSRRVGPHLRIDCEQNPFELKQDDDGNIADVRVFVESKIELPGIRRYLDNQGLEKETFVVELVEKSQGNFMYLHHVLPAIADGVYKDRNFATLPVGLLNYYEDNWKLIRKRDENAWFNYKLPVLVALTVVREPVSIDLIQDFSEVDQRPRIHDVLREWQQFLYVVEADDGGRSQKRYRIYHASFQDFVGDKEEVVDERVNLKEAHGKIADTLWKELYGDEQ